MRKFIFTGIAAAALLVGVASLMFTAAASARSTHAAKVAKVTIAMHDPGCHWFVSGPASKRVWTLTKTVKGPASLLNLDEKTLIVAGPNSVTKNVAVGKTATFKVKGKYTITMVQQASDDNTLTLTIK
jgi:hypothetical protein